MITVRVVRDYLLLRDIELDRDREGRVLLDIYHLRDALWDALEDQEEREKEKARAAGGSKGA
jgi:hypothetical protein